MAYRIYCYTNQITNQKYIGCTSYKYQCQRAGKNGDQYIRHCSAFGPAIIEYGWSNFVYSVLEDNLTKEQAEEREKFWIENLGTLYPSGYNLESGGKHHITHELTRKKKSVLQSGENNPYYGHTGENAWSYGMHWYNNGTSEIVSRECPEGYVKGRLPMSEEVKKSISQTSKGRQHSIDTRQKLSNSLNGHIVTEETRKKQSEMKRGRHYYNNGQITVMRYECPEGFVIGRLM